MDICHYLRTVLFTTAGGGCYWHGVSRGQRFAQDPPRHRTALSLPPKQRIIRVKTPIVPRLKISVFQDHWKYVLISFLSPWRCYCFNKLQIYGEWQWLPITVEENLKFWLWSTKPCVIWPWPAPGASSYSYLCPRWSGDTGHSSNMADSPGIWTLATWEISPLFWLCILLTFLFGPHFIWEMLSNHLDCKCHHASHLSFYVLVTLFLFTDSALVPGTEKMHRTHVSSE